MCKYLIDEPVSTDRGTQVIKTCELFHVGCDECPLPQSCKHWREKNTEEDYDKCYYWENTLDLEMLSLCSEDHCPIKDEKEWI